MVARSVERGRVEPHRLTKLRQTRLTDSAGTRSPFLCWFASPCDNALLVLLRTLSGFRSLQRRRRKFDFRDLRPPRPQRFRPSSCTSPTTPTEPALTDKDEGEKGRRNTTDSAALRANSTSANAPACARGDGLLATAPSGGHGARRLAVVVEAEEREGDRFAMARPARSLPCLPPACGCARRRGPPPLLLEGSEP